MSKSFVVDRVNGDKPLENDSVVTIYDSIDDAQLDIDNIEEGQIVGTNDNVGSETIEEQIKADIDEYAENSMQSYGQVVGSYLTMEDNSVTPQGYLLADGSTFNAGDYPLLYAYLGTNVLPTSQTSTGVYRYIKAVSGIETTTPEATEVANAIAVAEAGLESKIDNISSSWVNVTSDFTLTDRDRWTNANLTVYWNKYLRELRVYSTTSVVSSASNPHTFDITYNGTDTLIDFSSNTLMVDQSLRCATYATTHSGFEGFYTVIGSNQIQLGGYNRNNSSGWPVNATICARISL